MRVALALTLLVVGAAAVNASGTYPEVIGEEGSPPPRWHFLPPNPSATPLTRSDTRQNLHALRSFTATFRRAHAHADTREFEPLICTSQVQRWAIDDLLHDFGRRFSYPIIRISVRPFAPSANEQHARWNITPTHRFVVWYALSRDQPSFAESFVIGRVDGEYRFALPTAAVRRPVQNV